MVTCTLHCRCTRMCMLHARVPLVAWHPPRRDERGEDVGLVHHMPRLAGRWLGCSCVAAAVQLYVGTNCVLAPAVCWLLTSL